nr:MAG TPA: hypothetical protein [Caudoviricetes sp.]
MKIIRGKDGRMILIMLWEIYLHLPINIWGILPIYLMLWAIS